MAETMVVKTVIFDAAHSLLGHNGLCKNVHGHTYKVDIFTRGELCQEGSSEGMVVDFSVIKEVAQKVIMLPFDHAHLIWAKDLEMVSHFENSSHKTFIMTDRPTAENMARHFYITFDEALRQVTTAMPNHIKLHKIRVYETPTSYAEYPFMPNWEK